MLAYGVVWFADLRSLSVAYGSSACLLPFELSTRLSFLGAVASIAIFLFLGRGRADLRRWVLGGWLLSFPLIMVTLRGFGENGVLTSNWGGLLLTLISVGRGYRRLFSARRVFSTLFAKAVCLLSDGFQRLILRWFAVCR